MVIDPVADLIIQLKNAGAVGKEVISVPYSKFKFAVASKLKESGYIKNVTKRGRKTHKCIEIELLYGENGTTRINGVSRVSKPSRRVYEKASSIKPVKYGKGALILSTPKGILTDKEARVQNIGGEVLFKIW